ncbi:NfeD family protein [Saccharicrinis sp. FJH54]|uniref:NfeD family protein n=1 Tax=Saccharicrinis sp. FJH54 TaxID=3344665 RepID=UPI0035D4FF1B
MDLQTLLQPHIIWFLVGIVLLLLELAIPGIFVIFFGAGAIITAVASYIFDIDINVQILVFVISSVILLFALRRWLKRKFFDKTGEKDNTLEDEFIGKRAVAETAFKKGQTGKVTFKGTSWSARCADSDVKKDDILTIIDKESITLIVKQNQ